MRVSWGAWCHGWIFGCCFGCCFQGENQRRTPDTKFNSFGSNFKNQSWHQNKKELQTDLVAANLGHKANPLLVEFVLMVKWKVWRRASEHVWLDFDCDLWRCHTLHPLPTVGAWIENSFLLRFITVLATLWHHRRRHVPRLQVFWTDHWQWARK